jgi:hypothetical protein
MLAKVLEKQEAAGTATLKGPAYKQVLRATIWMLDLLLDCLVCIPFGLSMADAGLLPCLHSNLHRTLQISEEVERIFVVLSPWGEPGHKEAVHADAMLQEQLLQEVVPSIAGDQHQHFKRSSDSCHGVACLEFCNRLDIRMYEFMLDSVVQLCEISSRG